MLPPRPPRRLSSRPLGGAIGFVSTGSGGAAVGASGSVSEASSTAGGGGPMLATGEGSSEAGGGSGFAPLRATTLGFAFGFGGMACVYVVAVCRMVKLGFGGGKTWFGGAQTMEPLVTRALRKHAKSLVCVNKSAVNC